MDFLTQQNRRGAGDRVPTEGPGAIYAKDKHVIVIGGGDTGSDCVGTSIRQGAAVVLATGNPAAAARRLQPRHPLARVAANHADLLLAGGRLPAALERATQAAHRHRRPRRATPRRGQSSGRREGAAGRCKEGPGTEFTLPADLVLIAMGFVHVVHAGLVEQFGLQARQPRQRGRAIAT